MIVTVNGEQRELPADATVASARRGALAPPPRRGGGGRRRGGAARGMGRHVAARTAPGSRSWRRFREDERDGRATRDRRSRVRLAADARDGRLPQPRGAGRGAGGLGRRDVHGRAAPARPGRPRLDPRRARRGLRPDPPEHRRLLHRPRRDHHRAARPRGVRDQLDQARGDRRRPDADPRRARAAASPPSSWSTTASSCSPTRPTTRCWRGGSRTSAARR